MRGCGQMLRLVEMLCEQILLGGGEHLVNHFVEAGERLRIAVMALERLLIQVSCACARRQQPVTARERITRPVEKSFENGIGR